MLKALKKNLWSVICSLWALIVALFWLSMRVIWSGISKVIADAFGVGDPTAFLLNVPLYICILLWAILHFPLQAWYFCVTKSGPKLL